MAPPTLDEILVGVKDKPAGAVRATREVVIGFDRPFVIEAARAGSAVVMLDRYVKYRIHAQQDSADQASGPFLPEVFALQRYYRKVLGENLSDFSGRIFLCRNYRNLLGEFIRLNRNGHPPLVREAFFRDAIAAEAASPWSLRCGALYAALSRIPRQIERSIKVFGRNSFGNNS